MTCLDDTVALDVADDGRGFPAPSPDAPRDPLGDPDPLRGHGLPAIRARLRQLGGTLAIESTPGGGAVLTATIPLPPASEPAP